MPSSAPDYSLSLIARYVYALRPWSWTASIIPILVTSAVVHSIHNNNDSYNNLSLILRLLLATICIQAAANAINTCEDYSNGVDTDQQKGGDRSLVDKMVHPRALHWLGYSLLSLGIAVTWPIFTNWAELSGAHGSDTALNFDKQSAVYLFASGVVISVMYTAPPLRLKYNALGDVAVFLCFGPLLMHFIAVVLTGQMQGAINIYTVPVGLLTVAILHGNNTRDIQNDKNAGITTLAVIIGFNACRTFYILIICTSYVSTLYIANVQNLPGLLMVFLTLPIGLGLCQNFKPDSVINADEETAKFHMLFGLLMAFGIHTSPNVAYLLSNIR